MLYEGFKGVHSFFSHSPNFFFLGNFCDVDLDLTQLASFGI